MLFRQPGAAASLLKYVCLRLIYFLLFRTLLRLEARGLQHLPRKGPYLICPNHQSYLDPFVLVATLPYGVFRKMFFVGYSVFFESWIMKTVARLTNVVPVDPDSHLLRAMKAGACGLRNGLILCIFPKAAGPTTGNCRYSRKARLSYPGSSRSRLSRWGFRERTKCGRGTASASACTK